MELDRSTVKTGDYQRIKLSELDECMQSGSNNSNSGLSQLQNDSTMVVADVGPQSSAAQRAIASAAAAARVPRTIEVEVRDTLVNTCIPGDLLAIVGIVKTIQASNRLVSFKV